MVPRCLRWLAAPTLLLLAASCSSSIAAPETAEETISQEGVEAAPIDSPTPTSDAQQHGDSLRLLAHRGVHQTFDREGIDDDTCTAERIIASEHNFMENTIPSIGAAFDLGAEVVEIDIAPSSDGVLVVFHDWTVDCRTDGTGEVRSLSWEELSQLDIGYGYTVDGESFPLRGQGQGLMPRLADVFAAFPDGQFLINFKSDDVSEAELLQTVVEEAGAADQVWAVYGGQGAVEAYVSLTDSRGFTVASAAICLTTYVTSPDEIDEACSNTVAIVPQSTLGLLPSEPEQLVEAMTDLNTHVIITEVGGTGVDSVDGFEALPQDLDAYVWTDRIDLLGSLN